MDHDIAIVYIILLNFAVLHHVNTVIEHAPRDRLRAEKRRLGRSPDSGLAGSPLFRISLAYDNTFRVIPEIFFIRTSFLSGAALHCSTSSASDSTNILFIACPPFGILRTAAHTQFTAGTIRYPQAL